ncbi:MAG TPA: YccF domain-containing protein [Anaerolineae bacterium]|nr:YccF domain-containing protein [Anaerolineae bacterium]
MANVHVQKANQTPFILRALWFVLAGWHLSAGWIAVAWFLNVTIIGLPLGLWMLNRIPQVLTLKSMGGTVVINKKSGEIWHEAQSQLFWPLRAIYFVVFGWWVSLIWAGFGYLLCVSIIGLPFGLVMLNSLPFVTTLRR